ncbi:MAG TPA: hypothetical protein VJU84_00035 [Pyrinomonadaceae bacterium]|nr:hypothetical protein [Pyrinomonadaceae bacterium]
MRDRGDAWLCSRAGVLAMVFKLAKSAEQRWSKLKGAAHLTQVIKGVRFKVGLQQEAQRIAADFSIPNICKKLGGVLPKLLLRLGSSNRTAAPHE